MTLSAAVDSTKFELGEILPIGRTTVMRTNDRSPWNQHPMSLQQQQVRPIRAFAMV